MTAYAWVITKDHIDGKDKGVRGPSGCGVSADYIRRHEKAVKFKMYDGDGELYYEGYFVQLCSHGAAVLIGEDLTFAPLDDFGRPNAGCVEIKYRKKKKKSWVWETL